MDITLQDLQTTFDIPPETAQKVLKILQNPDVTLYDRLLNINGIIGGMGVETIPDPRGGSEPLADYINVGETYSPTLVLVDDEIIIASWGDVLEEKEKILDEELISNIDKVIDELIAEKSLEEGIGGEAQSEVFDKIKESSDPFYADTEMIKGFLEDANFIISEEDAATALADFFDFLGQTADVTVQENANLQDWEINLPVEKVIGLIEQFETKNPKFGILDMQAHAAGENTVIGLGITPYI